MAKFDNFKQYIEARNSFANNNEAREFLQEHYTIHKGINFLLKRLDVINDELVQHEILTLLVEYKETRNKILCQLRNFPGRVCAYYGFNLKYAKLTPTAKLFLYKLYVTENQTLNDKKSFKKFCYLTAFQIATSLSGGNDLKELYSIISQNEPSFAKQIIKSVNKEISYILKLSNSIDALERFGPFARKYD